MLQRQVLEGALEGSGFGEAGARDWPCLEKELFKLALGLYALLVLAVHFKDGVDAAASADVAQEMCSGVVAAGDTRVAKPGVAKAGTVLRPVLGAVLGTILGVRQQLRRRPNRCSRWCPRRGPRPRLRPRPRRGAWGCIGGMQLQLRESLFFVGHKRLVVRPAAKSSATSK